MDISNGSWKYGYINEKTAGCTVNILDYYMIINAFDVAGGYKNAVEVLNVFFFNVELLRNIFLKKRINVWSFQVRKSRGSERNFCGHFQQMFHIMFTWCLTTVYH